MTSIPPYRTVMTLDDNKLEICYSSLNVVRLSQRKSIQLELRDWWLRKSLYYLVISPDTNKQKLLIVLIWGLWGLDKQIQDLSPLTCKVRQVSNSRWVTMWQEWSHDSSVDLVLVLSVFTWVSRPGEVRPGQFKWIVIYSDERSDVPSCIIRSVLSIKIQLCITITLAATFYLCPAN